MDIDKFGEIMDEFLKVNHVQMLIDMPEGTEDVTIKDNVEMGPAVHFYILLQALTTVYKSFRELLDEDLEENFIDDTLALVKRDILRTEEDHE